MICDSCSEIPGIVSADVLAKQSLPHCVEHFEDFGYYGDDLDAYRLKKCPDCGSFFAQHVWDHFEEGGAVGVSIKRIERTEAAGMIPRILEKIQSAEWLKSKCDLAKLEAELKRLESA